ncbi:MAG TPA: hypothetical protein VGD69_15955 [Herpetosiphonaceae bacterium]
MTNIHDRQIKATEKAPARFKPAHNGSLQRLPAPAAQEVMRDSTQELRPANILALQSSVGNTAVQRLLDERVQRQTAAAPSKTDPSTARTEALTRYKTWLEERLGEVDALQGDAKVSRIRGLLSQVERVSVALIGGTLPDVDKLPTAPDFEDGNKRGYVPPELVGTVRQLIERIERPITGATPSEQAQTEGSRYEAGMDWNARLGVPQYRTQSDNLAAPEATCNVTTFAMVAERLGYSRPELLQAIEAQLRTSYLATAEGKAASKDKPANEVEVPDTFWQTKAKSYLQTVNSEAKRYRQLRGGTLITPGKAAQVDEQMTALAGDFKGKAQTEDLLDFFLHLQKISRTTINSDTTPKKVIDKINPNDNTESLVEQVWGAWSNDSKKKLKECLEAGGAASMSLFHKGSGSTDTHIISIQSVAENGLIVDDPYGKIDPDYRRGSGEDAYADAGKTRSASNHRNTLDSANKQDWTVDSAQSPTSSETQGNSYELSYEIVKKVCRNLVLFHRAQEKKKR